jgi:predicted regulator of amino acid metabolism with ACT domain
MKQDDFLKKVTSKLDGLAQHHKAKPVVMNHVIEEIQARETSRYGLWKMSGFALAAAIAGFVVLPNSIEMSTKPQNQVVVTPKLSPQMVEDLEMLMVLGEDKVPHGS